MTCQRAANFDQVTGRYERCSDTETTPQLIGITIADEQQFYVVDLCQFHIVTATWRKGLDGS